MKDRLSRGNRELAEGIKKVLPVESDVNPIEVARDISKHIRDQRANGARVGIASNVNVDKTGVGSLNVDFVDTSSKKNSMVERKIGKGLKKGGKLILVEVDADKEQATGHILDLASSRKRT